MPKVRFSIGCVVLLVGSLPALAAPPDPAARRADALALAAAIDRHLDKSWTDNKIVPAPRIDDAAFQRRVYLQLAGRIPSVREIQDFLDSKDPQKRLLEIEKLLAGHRYPQHMASVWRSFMLPEAVARQSGPGLWSAAGSVAAKSIRCRRSL